MLRDVGNLHSTRIVHRTCRPSKYQGREATNKILKKQTIVITKDKHVEEGRDQERNGNILWPAMWKTSDNLANKRSYLRS